MARRSSKPPGLPSASVPDTKRTNLRVLAEHLGLSRTTISLVLNDAPLARRLSAETRERVIRAAESFGYRPNYFARSLGRKRTFLIGIIAPDFSHGYDSTILSGIERCLVESEYVYFVASHLWSPTHIARNVDMLLDRGAEGLLLINTSWQKEAGVPTVTIGGNVPAPAGSLIHIDNTAGVRLALNHLVQLGHRKIAFLKGHEGSSDTEVRWRSIVRTCKSLGIHLDPALTVQLQRIDMNGNYGIEEGHKAAQELLARKRAFTALIAFNDQSAIGAMHTFRDAGLAVPSDISVVGFDDIDVATVVYPPLTTIRQPLREMGERAARAVLNQIDQPGRPAERIAVKPELIVRASTAQLSGRASSRASLQRTTKIR